MKIIFALLLLVVVAQAKHVLQAKSKLAIKGSYIITLKQGSGVDLRDAHITDLKTRVTAANDVSEVGFTYDIGSFVGFAAKLSESMLAYELAHPDVDTIEADQVVTILDDPVEETDKQAAPSWGLNRISYRETWSNSPNSYPYIYNVSAGAGVHVYVLDTGILTTHVDFGGRALTGVSYVDGETSPIDQNGHGTHCAGTIGGTTYGVAKEATLIPVKVLGRTGSGTWAGIIKGIEYVSHEHARHKLPTIASMSLGGGISPTLDAAIVESIKKGVVYSLAAGNSNADACNSSPARVKEAITVGATANTDAIATYSNWGSCVDIFAPGTSITSDWFTSNTAVNTISGTSMACPHVSGVLALHMGYVYTNENRIVKPAEAQTWIVTQATPGAITGITSSKPNTPNELLFAPVA